MKRCFSLFLPVMFNKRCKIPERIVFILLFGLFAIGCASMSSELPETTVSPNILGDSVVA
jgi:hypothetical protein